MRVLLLYRPTLPSFRAQAIQVLHAAHALAERGHRVTLLADRGTGPHAPADVLAAYGLSEVPSLDLRIAPTRQRGIAGLWFRRQLARWWAGPPGVVLARDKRRLAQALRTHGRGAHTVVIEAHELDSLLQEDGDAARTLEAEVIAQADALVTNCGGTLAAWEASGHALPRVRRAIHNGTAPDRTQAEDVVVEDVIRSVGSARAYKGVALLLEVGPRLPVPLEIVGATEAERAELTGPGLQTRPPVPYPEVPALLHGARALVLSLSDNTFGRRLTSPLKLWDYLATDRPIVAPDLPTVQEIAELTAVPLHLYTPGDADSLVAAVQAALAAPPRRPFLRTWAARAEEIEAVLLEAGASP